eukprot:1149002-Pelagomonas_calceolata.AAC.1
MVFPPSIPCNSEKAKAAPISPFSASSTSRTTHPFQRSSSSRAILGGGTEGMRLSGKPLPPRRVTSNGDVRHKHAEGQEDDNESEDLWRGLPQRSSHNGGFRCRFGEGREVGKEDLRRMLPSRRFTFNAGHAGRRDPCAPREVSAKKGHRQRAKAEEEEEEEQQKDDLGILIVHPRIKFGEMSHWVDAHERWVRSCRLGLGTWVY